MPTRRPGRARVADLDFAMASAFTIEREKLSPYGLGINANMPSNHAKPASLAGNDGQRFFAYGFLEFRTEKRIGVPTRPNVSRKPFCK